MDFERILFMFGMFAILMIAFGTTIPSADVQTSLNQLFAPFPSFQQTVSALSPGASKCGAWDWGCQASVGVAQATGFIGAALGYPGVIAGAILGKINAFGSLMAFITFGSSASFSSVPFGSLFLLALFIVVAVGLFKLVRGNAIAGV